MATITYVEFDGTEHVIEVEDGLSVMEGAVNNAIPGIDADCGGVCSCATCHVHVPVEWRDVLPERAEPELDMLEFAPDRDEDSRLSCQLVVDSRLDGMVVRLPESQG
ncbi:MAG: 2Fe-2S iron-sulfur cluster-binding protein [Geodermatophilaceae bacterium]